MTALLFGLTVFIAAYVADLVANHWGFRGEGGERLLRSVQSVAPRVRRRMSSGPKGHPSSALYVRKTGIRSA